MEGFFSPQQGGKTMIEEKKEESTYRKLCRLSVPRKKVIERHYLFPNGYDTSNLITNEPFNILFGDLRQLTKDGKIVVHLDRGVMDVYDNGGSLMQTRQFSGFFESKNGSGVMIEDLTSQTSNYKPKEKYLSKNERFIKQL